MSFKRVLKPQVAVWTPAEAWFFHFKPETIPKLLVFEKKIDPKLIRDNLFMKSNKSTCNGHKLHIPKIYTSHLRAVNNFSHTDGINSGHSWPVSSYHKILKNSIFSELFSPKIFSQVFNQNFAEPLESIEALE